MKEKIKVLHVISSLWSGGVAVLLKNYYEHMDHSKIQFDFLVTSAQEGMTEQYFKNENSTIYHLKGHKHYFYTFFETIKIVRDGRYKIVHVHHNDVSFLQLLAAKMGGAKIRIAHSHDELFLTGLRRMRKVYCFFTSLFSNYHFACSLNAGRYLFGKGIDKNNFLVIHNAIDLERFSYSDAKRKTIRTMYGLDETFVIGNVGRLAWQKNQTLLLDAFKIITNSIPEARLFLIGKGEDKEKIVKKIASLNVQDKVLMIEVAENVEDYLSAFDVFVFPSHHEGLGIALLEAQASGLPCVISNKIPKEAIVNENVEVVDIQQSAEEWASKIFSAKHRGRLLSAPHNLKRTYDITKEAAYLENWYINLYEKSL